MTTIGRTYMNGTYRVHIAPDGAIKVNPGDWLSKYSAAIYNNFSHVHEFGRKNGAGVVELVKDVNRIIAGETLYHIPTYKFFSTGSGAPTPVKPPAPHVGGGKPPYLKHPDQEAAETAFLRGYVEHDFKLQGERLHVIEYIHLGTEIAETATVLAECLHLVSEGGLLAAGVSGVELTGAILTPIFVAVQTINALEAGYRIVGCVAVAYATVAWAFYDQEPGPSPVLMRRNRQWTHEPDREERRCRQAWNESVKETYDILSQYPTKGQASLRAWKALFRGIGENDRQKLLSRVMKPLGESKLSGGMFGTGGNLLDQFRVVGLRYPE